MGKTEGKSIDSLPQVMSPEELIESGLLPAGRSLIYSALRAGEIPARRIGKKYVISRDRLKEWLGSAA